MPNWWWEFAEIPEVDDYQELAWKIQVSFKLPQWVSELHHVENYYLASPVPTCLCQKGFPPATQSKVPLSGYPSGTAREDCGLCEGSPVLGGEIQPAYTGPTMPFGGEHPGVKESDGAICLLC